MLRDPRDFVISKALYRIYGGNPLHADLPKLGQYVELLRAKEKDPRSLPFIRIVALFQILNGRPPNPDMGTAPRLADIVQFEQAFPTPLSTRTNRWSRTVRSGGAVPYASRAGDDPRSARGAQARGALAPCGKLA